MASRSAEQRSRANSSGTVVHTNDIPGLRRGPSHYGDGGLLARIRGGLKAAGIEEASLRAEDLAPVDEFHIGGREATAHAVAKMKLRADMRVLDVGCGIGGAARFLAAEIGCQVEGIDLTPEYIAVAKTLTVMTGLTDKVSFETASALDMPFEGAAFDAAITIHVAMNIAKRAELYGEIARVLKPGAVFCNYEVGRLVEAVDFLGPLCLPEAHLVLHELFLDRCFEPATDQLRDRISMSSERPT